jgi:hypothetical protein
LLKKYEEVENTLKEFHCRHLNKLISYSVQICKDNFIGPSSPTFANDFLRVFNQIYYEFSSLKTYQLSVVSRWLGDVAEFPQQSPANIFASRKRRD